MKNSGHGLLLVWQIVGTVVLSGVFSALLRKLVEQYISAPRALILFVSLVVIISTILIATSYWNRWEPVPVAEDDRSAPKPAPPMPVPSINVSSVNQSGGITAGVVNVGDRKRGILAKDAPNMASLLGDSPKLGINISFSDGDHEATNFGELLGGVLNHAGFTVRGTPCMGIGSPKGIQIFDITNTPDGKAVASAIQKALLLGGHKSSIEDSSRAISDGPINIHIGAPTP